MIGQAMLNELDLDAGSIPGAPLTCRRLRDLAGCFADAAAYAARVASEDPVVYTVASAKPATGEGQLHYGLGVVMPGQVGAEYFLTRGHLHAWREAAEVYVGLRGEGAILLESEATGEARLLPLGPGKVVYVPGRTAHRTVNTGRQPLVYLGVYPAGAGHDYAVLAERGFRHAVIERDGRPMLVERARYQP